MDNINNKEEFKKQILYRANKLIEFYDNCDTEFSMGNEVYSLNIIVDNFIFTHVTSMDKLMGVYNNLNKKINNILNYSFSSRSTNFINFEYSSDGVFNRFAIRVTDEVMKQYEEFRVENGRR
jgi:hypothetical protein